MNVIGFTSVVNVAMQYFLSKGSGHVVNISSIAAIRGNGGAPAYGASKSYQTNYLQACAKKFATTVVYLNHRYSAWFCRYRDGSRPRVVLGGVSGKSRQTNLFSHTKETLACLYHEAVETHRLASKNTCLIASIIDCKPV